LEFKEICEKLNIGFALAHGTLLGAYRDKDFIRGDEEDIDITIEEKNSLKMPGLFLELEKKGFKKTRWFFYEGKFRTGAVAKDGHHIDILITHKKGNEVYIIGPKKPISKKPYTAFVYPGICFEKYNKLNFLGVEFNIPQYVEKFFVARYGKNWRTPQNWGVWGHLNPKISPSLRPDYEI
jgi:phosphorylcholine metabolism protein LicD